MVDFKLNSDFAYFLGVIAGDGYVGQNYIEIKTCDYKFLTDIYIPLVEKLFGIKPRLAKESSGLNAHRVYFSSKEIFEYLKSIKVEMSKAVLYTILSNLVKEKEIVRKGKGVYGQVL